jgi:hypothetical protein
MDEQVEFLKSEVEAAKAKLVEAQRRLQWHYDTTRYRRELDQSVTDLYNSDIDEEDIFKWVREKLEKLQS